MSAQLPNPPPHPCPGGCGATIPEHHVACESCFYLLPTQLRLEITNGDRNTKLAARIRGGQWLREHVVAGVPIDGGHHD